MNRFSLGHRFVLVAVTATALMLGGCKEIVDEEQKGLFVLDNQSGHDVVLTVFSTQQRSKLPLTLPLPNGKSVERTVFGGAGAIAYPELFFQGDSVLFLFSDGKQLLHYCPQSQQLSGRCAPQTHNILSLSEYATAPISKSSSKYTYTLNSSDYALAH